MDNVELAVRQTCHELAREMVRLEMFGRAAFRRGEWEEVGAIRAQRDSVQAQRTELLREIWRPLWRRGAA